MPACTAFGVKSSISVASSFGNGPELPLVWAPQPSRPRAAIAAAAAVSACLLRRRTAGQDMGSRSRRAPAQGFEVANPDRTAAGVDPSQLAKQRQRVGDAGARSAGPRGQLLAGEAERDLHAVGGLGAVAIGELGDPCGDAAHRVAAA